MPTAKTLQKNKALTQSFDHLVDLAEGRLQTLIDTDENRYTSFYTDKLLYSFGYNNPEINRDINSFIRDHQKTPVNPAVLTAEIQERLARQLPRRLHHIHLDSRDIFSPILKALATNGRFKFLCLEKPPALSASSYADNLVTLAELKEGASEHDSLIPDAAAIKQILKKHRSVLAGCIINPVCLNKGCVVTEKAMDPLLDQLKKARIPIIWDDSEAGFFRLGPIFTFDLYKVEPDALIYSQKISGKRSIHFAALSRKLNRLFPEDAAAISADAIPSLVILRSLLKHIAANSYDRTSRDLGNRIQGKLRALEANCGQKFSMAGRGLTWFIDLPTTEVRDALINAMKDAGYLIKALNTKKAAIFIYPPLCVSEQNVDMMIEAVKKFFEYEHC